MVSAVSAGGYDVTSMWRDLFKKIDTDGNGSIDKTEMGSVLSKNGPSVEDVFSKLDSDQDGTIGNNEFEEALSKLRAQRPPGPPPQAGAGAAPGDLFGKMDADGDGTISEAELKSAVSQMGPGGLDADKILKDVDTDGDAAISRSEHEAHMERMKEKQKAGPAPNFAAENSNSRVSWESRMIGMLLSAYDTSPSDSPETKSTYA
jgi:Ca2+-binding EF-hand superfamily protein